MYGPLLFNADLNILEVLHITRDIISQIPIEHLTLDQPEELRASGLGELASIVPQSQVPAPAQFLIQSGRVEVLHQPAAANPDDQANVNSATDHLIEDGEKIIGELARSNCDRRLLEGYRDLQSRIKGGEDIIRTGLTNITCTHLFEQSREELPASLLGMMQAHSVAVSMYIAQFPEWRQFAEHASESDLDPSYATDIALAAKKIARELSSEPSLADPEVPKIFLLLAEWLEDPKKASQRMMFAAVRTIGNFLQTTFSYARELLDKTASKAINSLSTLASKLIVASIAGAILMSPVVANLSEVAWVKHATEIVAQELKTRGVTVPGIP